MSKRDHVGGLAAKLVEARETAKLTQTAAAAAAQVDRSSLNLFELGKKTPSLATLYKLAAAYGINVCALLPGGVLPVVPASTKPAKPKKRKPAQ